MCSPVPLVHRPRPPLREAVCGHEPAPVEQPDAAPLPVLTVDYLQKIDQRHRGLPHQIKKINEGVWTKDASLRKFMDLKNHFRS